MAYLREAKATDLLRMTRCNLDPLTESYHLDFYLHYLTTWPKMFIVAEDQKGDICGYVMGKVEKDPDWVQFTNNYLPWHGHVTALTVAPQYRRVGIAQSLTKALEFECEKENAWFVDLFVRASNVGAVNLYKGMGYSVFRRVVDYYSDDPTGQKGSEDAFDMRKPLSRDTKKKHVRKDGENFRIDPEDLYHG